MVNLIYIAVVVHTLYAFYTDIRTRRIPNRWNVSVGIAGLSFHLVQGGWHGLGYSLLGGILLLGLTSVLQLFGAIGGGDVKWFAALGTWTGFVFSTTIFVYTFLFAGAFALLIFISQGSLFAIIKRWVKSIYYSLLLRSIEHVRLERNRPMREIPLMTAVAPAVAIGLWQSWMGG